MDSNDFRIYDTPLSGTPDVYRKTKIGAGVSPVIQAKPTGSPIKFSPALEPTFRRQESTGLIIFLIFRNAKTSL